MHPGSWCEMNIDTKIHRIKILKSQLINLHSQALAGQILNNHLDIVCGDGKIIRLAKLQKAGSKPLETKEFLRGVKNLHKLSIIIQENHDQPL